MSIFNDSVKIALLSNVGLDTLRARLQQRKYDVFVPAGYGVWTQELIEPNSDFFKANITDCFILLYGNSFPENLFVIAEQSIRLAALKLPSCNFYVSNIDISEETISAEKEKTYGIFSEYKWHTHIENLGKECPNIYVYDLKRLITRLGRDNCYSDKLWHISGNPYNAFFEKHLLTKIDNMLSTRYCARKKCLVLDLDNTLWGGVIGEDGVLGIELDSMGIGARFYDFQKKIKEIKNTGVVLAVASKNNLDDVETAFSHSSMYLSLNDFSIVKANWNLKSLNIEEISKELNIGLDSIVFVDDSPMERREVIQNLPEVSVPDFPEDTSTLASFAENLYYRYFCINSVSTEDRVKTEQYLENAARDEHKRLFQNPNAFLSDLDLRLNIKLFAESDMVRISQLLFKTNQFNLTSKRHTEKEIRLMLGVNNYYIFTGEVFDRFGNYGITLLSIIRIADKTAEIDTFLMSCRVMSRTVEYAFLYSIENFLKNLGVSKVESCYIPTSKNNVVSAFFDSLKYSLNETTIDGVKKYHFLLDDCVTGRPVHFVSVNGIL